MQYTVQDYIVQFNQSSLYVCWLCVSLSLHQGRNGRHERIDFITNKEKKSSRSKVGIVVGVLLGLLILAAVAAFLIWLFVCEYGWNTKWTLCHKFVLNEGYSWSNWKRNSEYLFLPSVLAKLGITSENCKVDHSHLLLRHSSLILKCKSGLFGLCNFPLVLAYLTAPTLSF